jgi:hypothetical protein
MTNPINDIFSQAQQGSVAAIIQVLNDKLAASGVRTRAMFADGVLQLLCEAATVEQMDQTTLPGRVKQILEAIAPRNIRRVNINSRIVCEQQLLWLDEIRRHPDKLLWSEEITLSKPNFFTQIQKDRQVKKSEALAGLPTQSAGQLRAQRQFQRGSLLGAGSVVLLLLAGWGLYTGFFSKGNSTAQAPAPVAQPAVTAQGSDLAVAANPGAGDAFAEAVRLAERAAQQGQRANTAAEWLAIATQWQQASDLMAKLPTTDPRAKLATERTATYRTNSAAALKAAQKQQPTAP